MCVNYIEIGQRIRDIRKQRGYTQEALAEAADLSASYVSHIELGAKSASLAAILQIAKALDTSLDQLLYGNQGNDSVSDNAQTFSSNLPAIQELLEMATEQERQFLYETVRAIRKSLRDNDFIT